MSIHSLASFLVCFCSEELDSLVYLFVDLIKIGFAMIVNIHFLALVEVII